MVARVVATEKALELIERLKSRYGPFFFYQSHGCCDGSAPMCYREEDFKIGVNDICIGTIGDTPFYMQKSLYDYWKHTQLIIDAIPGNGPTFSLDNFEDHHFITRSRVFTDEEYAEIKKSL